MKGGRHKVKEDNASYLRQVEAKKVIHVRAYSGVNSGEHIAIMADVISNV